MAFNSMEPTCTQPTEKHSAVICIALGLRGKLNTASSFAWPGNKQKDVSDGVGFGVQSKFKTLNPSLCTCLLHTSSDPKTLVSVPAYKALCRLKDTRRRALALRRF